MVFVTQYLVIEDRDSIHSGLTLLMVVRDSIKNTTFILKTYVGQDELMQMHFGRGEKHYADKVFSALTVANIRLEKNGSERLPPPLTVDCEILYDRNYTLQFIRGSKCRLSELAEPVGVSTDLTWRHVLNYYEEDKVGGLPLSYMFFIKMCENVRDNLTETNKKQFTKTFTERTRDRNMMICMKDYMKHSRHFNLNLDEIHLSNGKNLSSLCKTVRISLGSGGRTRLFRVLNADFTLVFHDVLTCYLVCRAFHEGTVNQMGPFVNTDGFFTRTGTLPIHFSTVDSVLYSIFHGISPTEIPSVCVLHRGVMLHSQAKFNKTIVSKYDTKNEIWRLVCFQINYLVGGEEDDDDYDGNLFLCELSCSKRAFCFPKTYVRTKLGNICETQFAKEIIDFLSRLKTKNSKLIVESNCNLQGETDRKSVV